MTSEEVMGLGMGPWKIGGVWVWRRVVEVARIFIYLPFVSILRFYHKYILLLLLKEIIDGIWYLGITH